MYNVRCLLLRQQRLRLEIELAAQFPQLFPALFQRQGGTVLLRQGRRVRLGQFLAVDHLLTEPLVVFAKYRKGAALRVVGQKIPVGGAPGVIHRRMAPLISGFGGGGATGFQIGAVNVGQAELLQAGAAHLANGVQGRQVGAFLDAAATAAENFFRAQVEQAVQPELFRDIGFVAGKGLVKLVVVGQLQLGKELIDGIDMGVGDRLLAITCL